MLVPFLEMQMFAAVLAEEGSFVRAARRLRVSQSNLTRKIARLEKMVGVKIFDRSTRRLELTTSGRILLPEMQLSVRHAERAWELVRYQGRIENGPIHLGYFPHVHSRLLPKLHRLDISELDRQLAGSAAAPQPRVVLETAPTPELVERVLRGRLDAAIGVSPVVDPVGDRELWIEPLARESFCVCIPKNHELARRASVPVRDFDGERLFWIPREMHPGFYDSTIEYIQSTGASPVLHEVYPSTQVFDIVSYGFGLALLPAASAHLNYMGVVFKPIADRFLQIETVMFARREHLRGRFQDLASFLLSQLRG